MQQFVNRVISWYPCCHGNCEQRIHGGSPFDRIISCQTCQAVPGYL
mgnify:FL=1